MTSKKRQRERSILDPCKLGLNLSIIGLTLLLRSRALAIATYLGERGGEGGGGNFAKISLSESRIYKKWQTSAIIQEISDSNLETGRNGSKSGVSWIIRES